MEEKLKSYLQLQLKFSSSDTDKIIYGMQGILSELSKLMILLIVSFPFGYADEILISTVVLLSIRCNCGGLHFSHYISCFVFTSAFYASVIILSNCPLTNSCLSFGLLMSFGIFALVGPVTSTMRPRLTPQEVRKYSQRVIVLLLFYSSLLILLESLPYRKIIYWVIVLQIFQLLCAKIARKGENYEKFSNTKDL